jgi:hypothetical protein
VPFSVQGEPGPEASITPKLWGGIQAGLKTNDGGWHSLTELLASEANRSNTERKPP